MGGYPDDPKSEMLREWVVAEQPEPGQMVDVTRAFRLESKPIPETLEDGQHLFKVLVVSVDPYLRLAIVPETPLGKCVTSYCLLRVEKVGPGARFQVGQHVVGHCGWRDYFVGDGERYYNVDLTLSRSVCHFVGILGMPGQTAYGGCKRILKVKEGDVVVVSAASGAVGSVVGQVCRILGASRVVGIAGGTDKCRDLIEELGFDAAIDYKVHTDREKMLAALRESCPDGIDKYFDNVGGYIANSIWPLLRSGARVAICGQIANYNQDPPPQPDFLMDILMNRATIRGFMNSEWAREPEFLEEFWRDMPAWIREGKLRVRETVLEGFQAIPEAFGMLFQRTERKKGKLVVKLSDD